MSDPFPDDHSPTLPQPEQEGSTPHQPGAARRVSPRGGGSDTVPGPNATPRTDWPRVSGYEILGELGGGGMGVVYKAREVRLDRLVALKMMRAPEWRPPSGTSEPPGPERNGEGEDRARFRIEAEAVARLQHPNLVQIFQLGEQGGRLFFAMELVEGGTLAGHAAGKPLPNREAAELVEVLARAMHHAHQRGVVHRDLKPSNVLLASGAASPRSPTSASPSTSTGAATSPCRRAPCSARRRTWRRSRPAGSPRKPAR